MENDTNFCNSFKFRLYKFKNYKETDNTSGVSVNFIAYMSKGRARIVDENNSIQIKKGDIFFIPKRARYKSFWYGEPEIEFISISFPYLPDFENKSYSAQLLPPSDATVMAMYEILDEDNENAFGVGKLYTLLAILMPQLKSKEKSKTERLLTSVKAALEKNPGLSVKEAAKECAVSESALYKAFNHSTISFARMRQNILMERAKGLLLSTDDSIEEISFQLGFSSSAYFRKCFKKHFGISPREMKKRECIFS